MIFLDDCQMKIKAPEYMVHSRARRVDCLRNYTGLICIILGALWGAEYSIKLAILSRQEASQITGGLLFGLAWFVYLVWLGFLEKSGDLSVRVNVYAARGGTLGQSGHCHDGACDRDYETCAG